MLFNSYEFIFAFLPITLLGFYLLAACSTRTAARAWLVAASLFFYGWWNPVYLLLITGSILVNYTVGYALGRHAQHDTPPPRRARVTLTLGIIFNLGLLAYFKYANFFVDTLNALVGTGFAIERILLPLAISFFTFQQIAYLVDAYKGLAHEYRFLDYCLFVTFFPQLIAGPIVHHQEMLPQFQRDETYVPRIRNIVVGFTWFTLGLFKKVVVADGIARFANPVFDQALAGQDPTLLAAWTGALAYTMQLYFDFSGYSDMAIGLGALFGIRITINFNAPYKARNIVEFWRRWHMTLSRFLRDYLYVPLGGNRRGKARRYINLMITMLLGGLWHGALWVFVAWGALHGLYLIINHMWTALRRRVAPTVNTAADRRTTGTSRIATIAGILVTFAAVVFGWVFFRAGSFPGEATITNARSFEVGWSIVRSMVGANGLDLADAGSHQNAAGWILATLGIVWLMPTTQEIMSRYHTPVGYNAPERHALPWFGLLQWRPGFVCAMILVALFLLSIVNLSRESEFLYFQF